MQKAWMYVALTCFFEWVWIYGFNAATAWWHWIGIFIIIVIDFQCLAKACELLPTGSVYAMFAGVGTAGTALMDIVLFNQPVNMRNLGFMLLIVIGVVGLNLADRTPKQVVKEGV